MTFARNLPVENVDSIGLVVFTWLQGSARKSKNANSSAASTMFATAFGHFTLNSVANASIALTASERWAASQMSASSWPTDAALSATPRERSTGDHGSQVWGWGRAVGGAAGYYLRLLDEGSTNADAFRADKYRVSS